jgi:hypothetical protein
MRLLVGPLFAALILATALTFSVSPDTAEARKRCGKVRANGMTATVIVRRGRVPCRRARRIVRNNFLYAGPPVKGWFCFTAHGSPGRPPRYGGVCAPNGQDPDTARKSILIGRPRSARASRSCDTRRFVIYAFGGVTCRKARRGVRWMRRHRKGYPGYNCSSGSGYRTGAYCKRGRRVFGFHPYD